MSCVRAIYSWEILEILPLIEKFDAESGYGYGIDKQEFVDSWVNLIRSKQGIIIAKFKDGRIVGALGAVTQRAPWSTQIKAQEAFFWIEPEFRGSPSSARMVKNYIQWATSLGIKRIQIVALCSTDTKDKVGQFYEAMGFGLVEQGFEIHLP